MKCVSIKGKLKTHFFLQIFRCLYEIFYTHFKYTYTYTDTHIYIYIYIYTHTQTQIDIYTNNIFICKNSYFGKMYFATIPKYQSIQFELLDSSSRPLFVIVKKCLYIVCL